MATSTFQNKKKERKRNGGERKKHLNTAANCSDGQHNTAQKITKGNSPGKA